MEWEILDKYFHERSGEVSSHPLVKHQIDSFNEFLDNKLNQIIVGFNPIKINNTSRPEVAERLKKFHINVIQPSITRPMFHTQDGTHIIMTPNMARMNNLTYSSNIYVTLHIIIEVLNDSGITEKKEKRINNVYIGRLPIMVGSQACTLSLIPHAGIEDKSECKFDLGGYFIVNGNEKVIVSQDRIKENYALTFNANSLTDSLSSEIRSTNDNTYLPAKTTSITLSGKPNHLGRTIRINTSFLKTEIPLFIMFRALGVLSDEEIIHHIVLDVENPKNKRYIQELTASCDEASDIYTREDAENYIIKNMTITLKTTRSIETLKYNLDHDFLPHVDKNYTRKALFLGSMIKKLLSIHLNYEEFDNRDSYMNKRIDTPGILMSNLFRQCYGKLTKELKVQIEKKLNEWRTNSSTPIVDIVEDTNIQRFFKQSLLDSWLKYSLATGNWGIKSLGNFQKIKQGVSQVLNRMSYHSTLSHLRRINTAMEKNGKLVQPRKLDNSQFGMICPAECFDPNTPILLWNGTIKEAKDIIVGDYLIDDKGNAVKVKSTCSGYKTMYEVIQNKNNFMNYTVTDNHILTLKVKKHKYSRKNKGTIQFMWFDKKKLRFKYKTIENNEQLEKFASSIDNDDVIDITIEKYLSLSKNVQKELYTFKSDGINWERKEVALDPYILGMWLGDGLSRGCGFITSDKELLDKWIEWGMDNDATITKNKQKYKYTISSTINNKGEKAPLKKLLSKYNLVNNKHIPLDYLTNDRKTRLAVLAGLVDTDGNVRQNRYEIKICQEEQNYKIIDDTEFLASSLGFSCTVNYHTFSCSVKENKRCKPYKELTITGKYLYEIPTVLISKKLDKSHNFWDEKRFSSSLQSTFKLVKKDVEPFVGWQLDGNGRFLLGDKSISHNTPEGAPVGLVKNMSLSTNISISMNSIHIRQVLIDNNVNIYNDDVMDRKSYLKDMGNENNVVVVINGDRIGYHQNPPELYAIMKNLKRTGYIYPMTSIVWDIKQSSLNISTEAGRMYRPLLIVDNNQLRVERLASEKNMTISEYIKDMSFDACICPDINICMNENYEKSDYREGFIEYLDLDEMNSSMIAMFPKDLTKGAKGTSLPAKYTHCEIHPSLMNGVLGANVPFSDHNQSPRNCYQCIYEEETVMLGDGSLKKIKDINIGDEIVSFDTNVFKTHNSYVVGFKKQMNTKPMVLITTITGRNIRTTNDHLFMTNQGWLPPMKFNDDTKVCILKKYEKDNICGKDIIDIGTCLFVPVVIQNVADCMVCDIEVSSPWQSFFAGDGFGVHNCAMGKQALGVYMSNFNERMDTIANVLNYPQKPLVTTKLSKYTHTHDMPSGINAIVAIMTHTGFNQEDSVMINSSALDRGLFVSTYYKTYKEQCSKNHSTGEEEVFTKIETVDTNKPYNYEKLDSDGFVPVNTYVDTGDIFIGKVMPRKINGVIKENDMSVSVKPNEGGYIDKNYTDYNQEAYKFAKVRIRRYRKPQIGDKLACYTPDHQYLTTEGWINVADITMNHYIATMVDGELKYQQPIKLHEYEHDGDMYEVKTNHYDLCVTPNHRMYVQGRHKSTKWGMKKAEDICGKCYRMKKNIDVWNPVFDENTPTELVVDEDKGMVTHFKFPEITRKKTYPEITVDIDSWLTIYGIYLAEGSVYKNCVRIAADKSRVQQALDKVIPKTCLKMSKTLSKGEYVSWNILCCNMSEYIGYGHIAITKKLKDWVWYLNQEQSQRLIYSMCLGDGTLMDNGTWRYYTSSTILADQFQRLCLQAGYSCNKRLKTPEGTRNYSLEELTNSGKPSYTNADYWVLTIITKQNESIVNKVIKDDITQDGMIKYKGKVYCVSVPKGEGIVYVRRNGTAVFSGNSRSAQKGTIGMEYRQQDMPFTKDGIVPDLIMNPHAIPSRMTIAQLLECVLGKACCLQGKHGDGTPFNTEKEQLTDIGKILESYGMEKYGNEILYDGRRGQQIKTEIFIGPTYYQRLKHMTFDKMHSRGSTGPVVWLTRQPSEGRSRAGGLRLGEMERDAIVAHGSSCFLKERMQDVSDDSKQFICTTCGFIAVSNPDKDLYRCDFCKNKANISQVRIPYSFKLLIQELQTMNVTLRIGL